MCQSMMTSCLTSLASNIIVGFTSTVLGTRRRKNRTCTSSRSLSASQQMFRWFQEAFDSFLLRICGNVGKLDSRPRDALIPATANYDMETS